MFLDYRRNNNLTIFLPMMRKNDSAALVLAALLIPCSASDRHRYE